MKVMENKYKEYRENAEFTFTEIASGIFQSDKTRHDNGDMFYSSKEVVSVAENNRVLITNLKGNHRANF